MSNIYIGFRVEVASRILPDKINDVVEAYNSQGDHRILDLQQNGRITVDKSNGLIIAHGAVDKNGPRPNGAMVNFALMTPCASDEELTRLIQIINVLGNGRLIRERVRTFLDGDSTLNNLPELKGIKAAMNEIDQLMPGFGNGGWYYAPEAVFGCDKK